MLGVRAGSSVATTADTQPGFPQLIPRAAHISDIGIPGSPWCHYLRRHTVILELRLRYRYLVTVLSDSQSIRRPG